MKKLGEIPSGKEQRELIKEHGKLVIEYAKAGMRITEEFEEIDPNNVKEPQLKTRAFEDFKRGRFE